MAKNVLTIFYNLFLLADGNDGNSKMTKFPQASLFDPELINWGDNGVYNSFEDYEGK